MNGIKFIVALPVALYRFEDNFLATLHKKCDRECRNHNGNEKTVIFHKHYNGGMFLRKANGRKKVCKKQ